MVADDVAAKRVRGMTGTQPFEWKRNSRSWSASITSMHTRAHTLDKGKMLLNEREKNRNYDREMMHRKPWKRIPRGDAESSRK